MKTTDSGIVRLVKELQFSNAFFKMWITEFGIVKLIKELQFSNAPCTISITDSGMITRSKLWHSLKAPCSTRVAPSGMRTSNKSSLRHPDASTLTHSSIGFMANTAWGLKCDAKLKRARIKFGVIYFLVWHLFGLGVVFHHFSMVLIGLLWFSLIFQQLASVYCSFSWMFNGFNWVLLAFLRFSLLCLWFSLFFSHGAFVHVLPVFSL